MNEALHTNEWLKTTLEAAVPGISGAYEGLIPPNKELPAIRYQVQSPGNDVTVVNGVRIWAAPLYLVAAVVQGSPVPLLALADAIDDALHKAAGETSTIRVLSCVRESPFTLTETDEGRVFRHAGGMYRTKVQAK